jgi:hypothetical protein
VTAAASWGWSAKKAYTSTPGAPVEGIAPAATFARDAVSASRKALPVGEWWVVAVHPNGQTVNASGRVITVTAEDVAKRAAVPARAAR